MSVDQLLAKALSTSSEDEAISCLRMARKKNNGKTTNVNIKGDTAHKSGTYNGQSAEYWYVKARGYYNELKRAVDAAEAFQYRARRFEQRLDEARSNLGMFRALTIVFGVMLIIMMITFAGTRHRDVEKETTLPVRAQLAIIEAITNVPVVKAPITAYNNLVK